MNKIVLNMRYKMGYQMGWVMWYLLIYLAIMLLIYYGLITTDLIGNDSGSFVYRIWGLLFFQFSVSLRFKEDFDLWLTFSNTREEIFQSLLGVAIAFSTICTSFIVLERVIVDYLNTRFGYQNVIDPFHFFAPYATDNLFLQSLFFFVLLFCCSILGIWLGSLFYRFGRKFRWAFWLIVSTIFILLTPWLLLSLYQQNALSPTVTAVGNFLRNFDLLISSGYLFLLTIVFTMAAYLTIRRLPQK